MGLSKCDTAVSLLNCLSKSFIWKLGKKTLCNTAVDFSSAWTFGFSQDRCQISFMIFLFKRKNDLTLVKLEDNQEVCITFLLLMFQSTVT